MKLVLGNKRDIREDAHGYQYRGGRGGGAGGGRKGRAQTITLLRYEVRLHALTCRHYEMSERTQSNWET